MEVSEDVTDWSNKLINGASVEEGMAVTEMEVAVHDVAGVIGEGSSSSGLRKPTECTSDACGNVDVGQSNVNSGENRGKGVTPRTYVAASMGNPWKKPDHVPILHPEDFNAISGDGISIDLNLDRVRANMEMLDRAVVGKILGRRASFFLLKSEIQRQWGRNEVLRGGPWFIGGNLVGLDRWTPNFSPASMEGLSSPVWIRLPNLPLQYWDERNIARIATKIGTPLWIDALTANWGRREYARVCVRMNLANKLQAGVWVNGWNGRFYQKVEYEGIGVMCFGCGKIGHRRDHCPLKDGGHADVGTRKTGEQLKQNEPMVKNTEQSSARIERTEKVQTRTAIHPVVKIEGGGHSKGGDSRIVDGGKDGKQGAIVGPSTGKECTQESDDELGPWIQVPPRRRRSARPTGRNFVGNSNRQLQGNPKQIGLGKVDAPQSTLKPTHKQSRMGFKKPLPFTACMPPPLPKTNRFKFMKELSQLGPITEFSRKRRKEMIDITNGGEDSPIDSGGGDASPFVF
ncbi:hypothetical protein KFK09_003895 [Dendrobium nobile]|uniref:CCHC-type domain-containing protein n=1 Tax=Dendrobium nobile TaxID=94219 RepID=A0A8T3C4F7_DENNO|nr:hypothetical protein KFK09_003895 [Dendrobium nobile]